MRLLLLVLLGATLTGCTDGPADHGADVPQSAKASVDCAGAPYATGRGNYDTGPEAVKDDARDALDDWLGEEGFEFPDVTFVEAARHDDATLFTWDVSGSTLGAFVVRDDTRDLEGGRGWGVASYALCDPAEWPPADSDAIGIQVWSNADGDRVPTSLIESHAGPEHCGWQDTTFLHLGTEREFYGNPTADLRGLLLTTFEAHTALPADATDTGYAREGRELWLAVDDTAAYLVRAADDAERWPAARRPINCL